MNTVYSGKYTNINELMKAQQNLRELYPVIVRGSEMNAGGGCICRALSGMNNDTVTVKLCQEIVAEMSSKGDKVNELKFFKSGNFYARYWAGKNLLRIYGEYGNPIYENNNGVICRDECALADCLL